MKFKLGKGECENMRGIMDSESGEVSRLKVLVESKNY